jgi:hypothetical protein
VWKQEGRRDRELLIMDDVHLDPAHPFGREETGSAAAR